MLDSKNIESAKRYLKLHGYDAYDKCHKARLTRDHRLIDLVRDDIVDPVLAKIATKLSLLIDYRNISYTTNDEIALNIGIGKNHLSEKMKQLDKAGLVISVPTKGANKPERKLVFNPSLFWRGSLYVKAIRDEEIIIKGKDWRDMETFTQFDPLKDHDK